MNNLTQENSNNETELFGVGQIPMYGHGDTIIHPS